MKSSIVSTVCVLLMLISMPAFGYSRDNQGYGGVQQEGAQAEASKAPKDAPDEDWDDYGGGPSGMMIGGYVLLAVGGAAAIAGSTIVATTDKDVLGACVAAGGGAMSLAGTLMITLGSRSYAIAPAVDPKSGTYGLALASRF